MKKNFILFLLLLMLTGCEKTENTYQNGVHNHSFSSDWTFNEVTHWHHATCSHHELTSNLENHKFDKYGMCTICKYKRADYDPYIDSSTTIYFECNGGNKIEPIVVKYKEDVTLPIPEKEGYTFLGWTQDGKDFNLHTDDVSIFQSEVHLEAKWIVTNNEVTLYRDKMKGYVIFDYNDGRGIYSEFDLEENGDYIDFPCPDRVDKEFVGWSTTPYVEWGGSPYSSFTLYGSSGNRYYTKGIDTVPGKSTFYSLGKRFYAIWHDSISDNSLELSNGVAYPNDSEYQFYVDGSYDKIKLEICGNFDGNIYALDKIWYDSGNVRFSQIATLDCDKKYEIDTNRFYYESESFYNCRQYSFRLRQVNATKNLDQLDVSIKAFPNDNDKSSFVLSSDGNANGYIDGKKVNIKTNSSYSLPFSAISNYEFIGYYTEREGKGTKVTDNKGFSLKSWDDLSINKLYAYYIPKRLNIKFNTGCEDIIIDDIEIQFMSSFEFKTLQRAGYQFDGWYFGDTKVLDSGLSWIDFLENKSIELVAKWTLLKFRVTFCEKSSATDNKDGDYYYLDVYYDSDATLGMPINRTGFEFMGWYTGENGTGTKLTNKSGHLLENWHYLTDLFVHSYFQPIFN